MTVKDLAQVKLEAAHDKAQQAMSICLVQCQSPSPRNLHKLGSLLGDFANNLRSALNYTMRGFVDAQLKPLLTSGDFRPLERARDFPWADTAAAFERKPLVEQTKTHHRPFYGLLEGVQPYHTGNEWLRHLMRISNRDKHEIINNVGDPSAVAVVGIDPGGASHSRPRFFGPGNDRILVTSTPKPQVHMCPHYYRPYGAFAAKGEKWIFYFISIDGHELGFTRFLETVPQHVKLLINDLNAFI